MSQNNATPILPPEYQQIEWLQSHGNQWIDTGVSYNSGDIERCIVSAAGGLSNASLMGAQNINANTRTSIIFNGYITAGSLGAGNSNTSFPTANPYLLDFTIDDTAKKITGTCNGVAMGTTNYSGSTTNMTVYLFAPNSAYLQQQKTNGVYVYSVTYYKNGAKICDLIPCYRKSDNKPGMYDVITNSFKTNIGTGDFTIGQNV